MGSSFGSVIPGQTLHTPYKESSGWKSWRWMTSGDVGAVVADGVVKVQAQALKDVAGSVVVGWMAATIRARRRVSKP